MEETAEQLRREHLALEGDTHGKDKWAILFTVLVMTFMVCLDSTVVTVALPVMQKELGVGLDRIQLVSSVYLLATCVAMLPFGRLGDVRGKVNVFQLGVIVFSVGSLLCGLSASLEVLILARIVQGVGCAAAMANNMGIITESFPARERGRAMGILATFVALGMMCGPVLGGMLVASFPWESIFLINLPIGVISFIVGLYTLPHVKPEAGERPCRWRRPRVAALQIRPSPSTLPACSSCSLVLAHPSLSCRSIFRTPTALVPTFPDCCFWRCRW